MGGTWLTYLLLGLLIVTVMMVGLWAVDFVFDETRAFLQRRHERQALERWKRIQDLEKELEGDW